MFTDEKEILEAERFDESWDHFFIPKNVLDFFNVMPVFVLWKAGEAE